MPTITQVRKKTLLNKEEIACSEVIPLPSLFWISGSQLLFPILRAHLGGQRGRLSLRLVQVSISEQSEKPWPKSFWKHPFSDSPINGVNPCSRIEDVTNYQNALSKALLVSLSPFRSHPFPIFQARWLKLSEMTGCMPLCSVRSLTILPTTLFSLTNQRSFTFVEKTSEEANWARNWSSAFYLDVKTSSYIHQTEFYACKIKSFC